MLNSSIQCSQCHTHLSARGQWRTLSPAPRAIRCRVCGRSSRTTFAFRRAWMSRRLMTLLVVPATLLSYLTFWVAGMSEGDDAVVAAFIALPAAAVGLGLSYLACQTLSIPVQLLFELERGVRRLWRRPVLRRSSETAGTIETAQTTGDADETPPHITVRKAA